MPQNGQRWAAILAIASAGAALLTIALLGLFLRWNGDDYWQAGTFAVYGLWGAQKWWYMHWSGRTR
jgi:hypothetical protein